MLKGQGSGKDHPATILVPSFFCHPSKIRDPPSIISHRLVLRGLGDFVVQ
jgi:hypothetical protein